MLRLFACGCLIGCGGGASVVDDMPGAVVGSTDCNRLGPDNTGFMLDLQYMVALASGQAFTAELVFPTSDLPVNRSDIYNCGSWSTTGFGGDSEGCQRDPGQQAGSEQVFHSVAIEFAEPLFPPVTVTVIARPLRAPGSSAVGNSDLEMVDCL